MVCFKERVNFYLRSTRNVTDHSEKCQVSWTANLELRQPLVWVEFGEANFHVQILCRDEINVTNLHNFNILSDDKRVRQV